MKRVSNISLLSLFVAIISCSSFLYGQNKTISKEDIKKANRLIPQLVQSSSTINKETHPLSDKINAFITNQDNTTDFNPSGLKRADYLKIIEKQVRAMLKYQRSNGRIVDPIARAEKYYTTPCFAHSVATLISSGHIKKTDPLFESGVKALTESLSDMVNDTVNGNHGDFYTWPVMLAYENFKPFVSKEILKSWNKSLKEINISELYEFYNKEKAMNWILVHSSGEFLRANNSFTSKKYFERMLGFQLNNFTKLGMYNEGGNPLSYDLFARHYLAGVLQLGYKGKHLPVLQKNLWKGAWTSMFMESPFGELPTGYRSSHHIWNEAEQCVMFEIYASAYSDLGKKKEAGAFKRAAMLSLNSINQWIREDGSGYIVKNRFPTKNKHGYERYSVHTCYNMLATSMLAQAWQFSNDKIEEKPAPADIGGFVLKTKRFHKVFANVKGTYLEYETKTDDKYNPTGIVRIHLKGSNPQLGPSNGVAPQFGGEGNYLALGPHWKKNDGTWTSLATYKGYADITTIKESADEVVFSIKYIVDETENSEKSITEKITVKENQISVITTFDGITGEKKISWPLLTSDGKNQTKYTLSDNTIKASLLGKQIQFTVKEPNTKLTLSEEKLKQANGIVQGVFASFKGNKITYKLD